MIYFVTLGVFLIAFLDMAIGVIISNRPVKGSCGGLSALPDHDGSSPCDFCSKPKTDCAEFQAAQNQPQCAEDYCSEDEKLPERTSV